MTLKIVIAVDASPHARLALKVARTHYPEGHRQLLTVIDDRALPFREGMPVPVEAVVAEARHTLKDLAQATEVFEVVVGEPAVELLRAAERFGADVLVMGTHGRYGLNRWFGGSVAETVVRRADLPVLVVREASVEEPAVSTEAAHSEKAAPLLKPAPSPATGQLNLNSEEVNRTP